MKIISNTSDSQPDQPERIQVPMEVVSTPPSASTPSPANESRIDSVSETLLAEFRTLQDKFEQVRTRLTEQILQNTRQVAKLSEEITALREQRADHKTPEAAEPDLPSIKRLDAEPPTTIVWIEKEKPLAEASDRPSASVESSPEATQPSAEQPEKILMGQFEDTPTSENVINLQDPIERKVAFFAKLWDYLNQTAFEIPLRKSNRSN
jgi:hypothetical protein